MIRPLLSPTLMSPTPMRAFTTRRKFVRPSTSPCSVSSRVVGGVDEVQRPADLVLTTVEVVAARGNAVDRDKRNGGVSESGRVHRDHTDRLLEGVDRLHGLVDRGDLDRRRRVCRLLSVEEIGLEGATSR